MATKVKTLIQKGDTILPRTVASAVTMEDGRSLEAAMKHIDTVNIKISAELADTLGLAEGTDLTEILLSLLHNPTNVLAAAELVEEEDM